MDKNEVSFVRCLKCRKILQCSHKDISVLLQHIRTDHPEVQIVNSESKDEISNTSKRNKHNKRNGQNKNKNQKEKENSFKGSSNLDCKNNQDKNTVPDQDERIPLLCQCTSENQENQKHKRRLTAKQRRDKMDKRRAQRTNDRNKMSNLLCACTAENDSCDDSIGDTPRSQERNPCESETTASHAIDENDDNKQWDIPPEPEQNCEHSDNNECVKPSPSVNVLFTKRLKAHSPSISSVVSSPPSKKKRSMYCSTIEKWRPGWGTIYCPQCSSNKVPIVRTRSEQLTENQWFACCLFSCWPFCFLPCLKPQREIEYLHCSNCNAFLGVYNRKQNCLKPNREYVRRNRANNETMNEIENINLNLDNQEFAGILPTHRSQTGRKKQQPSIVINGKELHPDMVARLQHYRKYGELAGIDLSAVASDDNPEENSDPCADPVGNEKKQT